MSISTDDKIAPFKWAKPRCCKLHVTTLKLQYFQKGRDAFMKPGERAQI